MYKKIIPCSPFGPVVIIWSTVDSRVRLSRIIISRPDWPADLQAAQLYPGARAYSCTELDGLADALKRFLAGEALSFPLTLVALEPLSTLQRSILRVVHGIPRGQTYSYQAVAIRAGSPRGARAVGRAMADNSWPLIVPCHRVIRADGQLGGFGGGTAMKRGLLALEGVRFDRSGRITPRA